VARFLKLTGSQHGSGELISEVTGPTFDPSGTRLYFSSQRAYGLGQVYEVTGPFRTRRQPGAPIGSQSHHRAPPPAPALGLEVTRRRRRKALMRDGLRVALTLDEAAPVVITVRTTLMVTGRRRTITLARLSRTVDAGPETLRIRLGAKARERLRGRKRFRLSVEIAIGPAGARTRRRRSVVVRP
jgi:hypothetical protein